MARSRGHDALGCDRMAGRAGRSVRDEADGDGGRLDGIGEPPAFIGSEIGRGWF